MQHKILKNQGLHVLYHDFIQKVVERYLITQTPILFRESDYRVYENVESSVANETSRKASWQFSKDTS